MQCNVCVLYRGEDGEQAEVCVPLPGAGCQRQWEEHLHQRPGGQGTGGCGLYDVGRWVVVYVCILYICVHVPPMFL